MLEHRNNYEGMPPRLYRTPKEIRADITKVRERVCEIENMLSVREILMSISDVQNEPEIWIPELERAVDEASDALENLKFLRERLQLLGEELCEVKCLIRA